MCVCICCAIVYLQALYIETVQSLAEAISLFHFSFLFMFLVSPPPLFWGGRKERKKKSAVETLNNRDQNKSHFRAFTYRVVFVQQTGDGKPSFFFCILFLILFMHLCFFVLQQDFYLFKEHTHTQLRRLWKIDGGGGGEDEGDRYCQRDMFYPIRSNR